MVITTAGPASKVEEVQNSGLPTLHHLNNAQSQRIIWLLEALGVEYNLINHIRIGDRSPPSLAKIPPLGKAPTLITREGKTIVETSAITSYLIKTYDSDGIFGTDDWLREETLTSFAAATLGALTDTELVVELLPKHSPWPVSIIMKKVHSMVQQKYTTAEFKKTMKYLEGELGDSEWFNGKHMGKSDVMLSWPLDMMAHRGWVDFEGKWPKLAAWRKRILDSDAWKKGIEKGNGYDLAQLGVDSA